LGPTRSFFSALEGWRPGLGWTPPPPCLNKSLGVPSVSGTAPPPVSTALCALRQIPTGTPPVGKNNVITSLPPCCHPAGGDARGPRAAREGGCFPDRAFFGRIRTPSRSGVVCRGEGRGLPSLFFTLWILIPIFFGPKLECLGTVPKGIRFPAEQFYACGPCSTLPCRPGLERKAVCFRISPVVVVNLMA